MNHNLRKLSAKGLEIMDFENFKSLDPDQNYWMEVQADSRSEVIHFLSEMDFSKELIDLVMEPFNITRVNIYGNDLLVNLVVSSTENILRSENLTIVVRPHLLITILNEGNTLLKALEEDVNLLNVDLNLVHLFYYILAEIIQQGMTSLKESKRQVKMLSEKLEKEPDTVSLDDIIRCKTEISRLEDIVEEQYNMLAFVPKIDWTEESKSLRLELKEQTHGLDYLKKAYERLVSKVENIHSHYQLILQEKGNKRLNTLTLVQAIFVPNTFIAGIYGMNFSFMPELEWKFGYFIILGIISAITIFQLWWFNRKGWLK